MRSLKSMIFGLVTAFFLGFVTGTYFFGQVGTTVAHEGIVLAEHVSPELFKTRLSVLPAEVASMIEIIEHEYGRGVFAGILTDSCEEVAKGLVFCSVILVPLPIAIGKAAFYQGQAVALMIARATGSIYTWDPKGIFGGKLDWMNKTRT